MGPLETSSIIADAENIARRIGELPENEKIEAINMVRRVLHEVSPFREEPVDFVEWVPCDDVRSNDYNPNSVAPPEMRLLALSIHADGYTQPIVTFPEEPALTVVDGFHRNRIGKEDAVVRTRVLGHLPVVKIRNDRSERQDRMAATIRHNRARGRHSVDEMSKIVAELAKKSWPDEKIAKELGMDQDEVLRLKQITGLAELFSSAEFNAAWEINEEAMKG